MVIKGKGKVRASQKRSEMVLKIIKREKKVRNSQKWSEKIGQNRKN
jgi:hypothetical protein